MHYRGFGKDVVKTFWENVAKSVCTCIVSLNCTAEESGSKIISRLLLLSDCQKA